MMTTRSCSRKPRREPLCSSLPNEVWISIFSHHSDLVHLWNVCRCVSSTLRACAEHTFAQHFLSELRIDFQLEKYNLGGKTRRPEMPVIFERIGKHANREIAYFSDKRSKSEVCEASGSTGRGKKLQEQYDRVMHRWEENVQGYKPEMPNYTINIRGLVNDTALPGLALDVPSRTITFNWRKALTLFYREQAYFQALKQAWQVRTNQKIRANNVRLAAGEKLMPSDYPKPWSSAESEIWKTVRRARLKEMYADDEQMCWAIESLRHFEQYGNASGGNTKALKIDPVDLPGAGLGERWFGRVNIVQELYLDEWSCMHRIEVKRESLREEA